MAKPSTEYVGTLMAYAKLPKSGGAWKFTLPDQSTVSFVPVVNDAVMFVYKTQGYVPEILPHLVACPLGEGKGQEMLVVSRWIEGKVGQATSAADDEL